MVSEQFSEFEFVDDSVLVLIKSFEGFEGIEEWSAGESLSDLFRVEFVLNDFIKNLSQEFNSVRREDFRKVFSVNVSWLSVSDNGSIGTVLWLDHVAEFSILQETILIFIVFIEDEVQFIGGWEDIDIVNGVLQLELGDVTLFSQIEASESIEEVEVFL